MLNKVIIIMITNNDYFIALYKGTQKAIKTKQNKTKQKTDKKNQKKKPKKKNENENENDLNH